jgi:hypothetical protein
MTEQFKRNKWWGQANRLAFRLERQEFSYNAYRSRNARKETRDVLKRLVVLCWKMYKKEERRDKTNRKSDARNERINSDGNG